MGVQGRGVAPASLHRDLFEHGTLPEDRRAVVVVVGGLRGADDVGSAASAQRPAPPGGKELPMARSWLIFRKKWRARWSISLHTWILVF